MVILRYNLGYILAFSTAILGIKFLLVCWIDDHSSKILLWLSFLHVLFLEKLLFFLNCCTISLVGFWKKVNVCIKSIVFIWKLHTFSLCIKLLMLFLMAHLCISVFFFLYIGYGSLSQPNFDVVRSVYNKMLTNQEKTEIKVISYISFFLSLIYLLIA